MSLYFYDTTEQDDLMLKRLSEYPKPIKNIIFNHEFLWFHNRPSVKQWNNIISMFDIDWSLDTQKHFVLGLFKQEIDLVEGDPWVLR